MDLVLAVLPILIPVTLVVHVVRTGRPFFWIWIIIIVPVVGALAYVAAEVLPDYIGGHHFDNAMHALKKMMFPNKDLEEARHALETTPTVANRIRLGRVLLERGAHDEAIGVLEPARTNFFTEDPAVLEELATAYYKKNAFKEALATIEQIRANKDWPVKARMELLAAEIHDKEKNGAEAEEIYRRVVKSAPGEEAKVAYGQFLLRQNRPAEAKAIFEDVVKRAKFMSPHTRKLERDRIRLARRELAQLAKIGST